MTMPIQFSLEKTYDITENEVWKHFEDCGEIEDVRIIRDNKTGTGKGIGYIEFKVSRRKCAHKRAMEVSSIMTEEKRQNIEVGNTTDVGFKLKQSSYENTLKDIDAQNLIQKQRDKHLQSVQTAKCFLIDRLYKQITSLLREIKVKDSMIQQLRNKIEFDKLREKTEENKLDAVIAEIEAMRSTIKELWCEVKKNSPSDTKNITLNISQIRNLQISTEE